MTPTLRPNGIYYRGRYKVRQDSETGRWLVIHRPTTAVLSAHDERVHAIEEAERLAIAAHVMRTR